MKNRMMKMAKYLSGKGSYQDKNLDNRIYRQQLMLSDQVRKAREAEIKFYNERLTLLRFQTDLEIMFMVSDIHRKKRNRHKK